jgi:transposase-like protein
MEAKRKHIIYKEEFRRQAVEMVIHSGKTQAQVARERGRHRAIRTRRAWEPSEKINPVLGIGEL